MLIAGYVLLTGEFPRAIQAAMFGLTGGGETAFTLAFLLGFAVDIARLAPLFLLARHPLGILHPIVIAVLLWPLLVSIPSVVEQFGGLSGLFLGMPIHAPFFRGLGWQQGETVWLAVAKFNGLQLLALLCTYLGFTLSRREVDGTSLHRPVFNKDHLRRLAIVLIALNFIGLMVFLEFRGGLNVHLADLGRGRFRSLTGLGPLVAIFDIGLVAMLLWIAARPDDVRSLPFLAGIAAVAAAQFLSNGSRSGALTVFMLAALAWALRKRRVPWRLAVVLAPVIFLSLGVLNIARTSSWGGQDATAAIAQADAGQVLAQVQEEIEIRRSLAGAVPVVEDGFRVMGGPLLGSTYVAAIFAMVPRTVWEAKPRGPGSIYAQNFLGELREGVAVPIGPVAESYWNFGVPGVILLFFLYGFLLRRAHNLFMSRPDNAFVTAFFVLFATGFRVSTDDLVLFQQQMILFLLIYLLAKATCRRMGEAETISYPAPALSA